MKTNILFSMTLLIIIFGTFGCDDYLSKAPSKNEDLEIETVEQLEALIANHNIKSRSSESKKAALYASDNFEISKEFYKTPKGLSPSLAIYQYYTWNMELAADDPNDMGWGEYFNHVYNANLIIKEIETVSGEADRKQKLIAEAHFIRAYNYLSMASVYCLPYGSRTKLEPGLPIKRTTSFEENLERASLEDTYAFIEQDILEAIKTDVPLYQNGLRRIWHANKAAAYALAARFYLLKGMYEKAEQYADMALEEDDLIIDYNSGIITQKEEIGVDENLNPVIIMLPSTWTNKSDELTFSKETEMYYQKSIFTFIDLCWLIPSKKLLSLYNSEYDLRYHFFIVPNFSYSQFMNTEFPGYCTYNYEVTSGLSSVEMWLIKAECMIRTGANITEAMTILNKVREKRFDHSAPRTIIELNTTDSREALQYVLEERSREMPFTMRWSDIRRCNFNEDPNDDIVITRSFYDVDAYGVKEEQPKEYKLTPDSRRYASPIPLREIIASNGVIKQNEY